MHQQKNRGERPLDPGVNERSEPKPGRLLGD